MATETLACSAVVSGSDNWSLGAGTDKVSAVATADGNTSYVYSATNQAIQQFDLADPAVISSNDIIAGVAYQASCARGSSYNSAFIVSLVLGGSSTDGTSTTAGSSYPGSPTSETLNRPGGGNWSLADLQNLRVQIKLNNSNSYQVNCSLLNVVVTYYPPTGKSDTDSGGGSEGVPTLPAAATDADETTGPEDEPELVPIVAGEDAETGEGAEGDPEFLISFADADAGTGEDIGSTCTVYPVINLPVPVRFRLDTAEGRIKVSFAVAVDPTVADAGFGLDWGSVESPDEDVVQVDSDSGEGADSGQVAVVTAATSGFRTFPITWSAGSGNLPGDYQVVNLPLPGRLRLVTSEGRFGFILSASVDPAITDAGVGFDWGSVESPDEDVVQSDSDLGAGEDAGQVGVIAAATSGFRNLPVTWASASGILLGLVPISDSDSPSGMEGTPEILLDFADADDGSGAEGDESVAIPIPDTDAVSGSEETSDLSSSAVDADEAGDPDEIPECSAETDATDAGTVEDVSLEFVESDSDSGSAVDSCLVVDPYMAGFRVPFTFWAWAFGLLPVGQSVSKSGSDHGWATEYAFPGTGTAGFRVPFPFWPWAFGYLGSGAALSRSGSDSGSGVEGAPLSTAGVSDGDQAGFAEEPSDLIRVFSGSDSGTCAESIEAVRVVRSDSDSGEGSELDPTLIPELEEGDEVSGLDSGPLPGMESIDDDPVTATEATPILAHVSVEEDEASGVEDESSLLGAPDGIDDGLGADEIPDLVLESTGDDSDSGSESSPILTFATLEEDESAGEEGEGLLETAPVGIDSGFGVDEGDVFVGLNLSAVDSGTSSGMTSILGSEVSASESATGIDFGQIASTYIPITEEDSGTGAETTIILMESSDDDSSEGSESEEPIFTGENVSDSDTSGGSEDFSFESEVSDSEPGPTIEVVVLAAFSTDLDSGSGEDASSPEDTLAAIDSAYSIDSSSILIDWNLSAYDSSMSSVATSILVSFVVAPDPALGLESETSLISSARTDVVTGTDAGSTSIVMSGSDSGSSPVSTSVLACSIDGIESCTGVEALSLAASVSTLGSVSGSDSGSTSIIMSGSDSGSSPASTSILTGTIGISDSCAFAEITTLAATTSTSDLASSSESRSILITLMKSASDAGLVSEQLPRIMASQADSGSVIEASVLSTVPFTVDLFSGFDSGLVHPIGFTLPVVGSRLIGCHFIRSSRQLIGVD